MLAVYGVMALTDIQPGEAYQAVDPPPLNSGLAHCCKTKSRAPTRRSAAKLWSPEQRLLRPPFSDLPPTPSQRLPRLHPQRASSSCRSRRPRAPQIPPPRAASATLSFAILNGSDLTSAKSSHRSYRRSSSRAQRHNSIL
jgi:hypothetical protein